MEEPRAWSFIKNNRDSCLAAGLILLTVLLFYFWASTLAPVIIAFILAYLLEPLVLAVRNLSISKFQISRMTSVIVIYVLIFLAGLGLGLPVLVNVTTGMVGLAEGLEKADLQGRALGLAQQVQLQLRELPLPDEWRQRLGIDDKDEHGETRILLAAAERARGIFTSLLRTGANAVSSLLSVSVHFILVPVFLFYLMLEFHKMRSWFELVVPLSFRPAMHGFLDRVDVRLGGFVRGRLLVALFFAILSTIGLSLLGVNKALLLGFIFGISSLIPYLGIVGLLPACVVILWQEGVTTEAFWLAMWVFLLYALVQTLEAYVLQPRILGESVGLHPLWIMVAMLIGQQVWGVPGLMVAVPIAAILHVFIEDCYPRLYGVADGV